MHAPAVLCHRRVRPCHALMALLAWLVAVDVSCGQAPIAMPGLMRFESRSLQFIVFGAPVGTLQGPPSLSLLESNHMQMEPALLVMTSERVKTELLRELGLGDNWTGRIVITVRGELPPTEPVTIESQWFATGWRYRVVLPGQLERTRLVRALTRALLLEIANRENPTQRPVEIPLWLEEGFATHLLALNGDNLVPEIRTRLTSVQSATPDVFLEARQRLRGRELVAFADLAMLHSDQLENEQWEVFRRTAHLLVAELLNLPDGRASLQTMLRQLPTYLNSQLAFQHAFAAQFPTLLDVEKWWSVVWMDFTARDQRMRHTLAHSLGQLDEILAAPISVRLGTNAVPGRKDLPLREVIAHTEFARHQPAVAQAALQLQLLQSAAPIELARLISDYRRTLLAYLRRRSDFKSVSKSADAKIATEDVLEKLDLLDVIRGDFRRLDTAASAAGPTGPE